MHPRRHKERAQAILSDDSDSRKTPDSNTVIYRPLPRYEISAFTRVILFNSHSNSVSIGGTQNPCLFSDVAMQNTNLSYSPLQITAKKKKSHPQLMEQEGLLAQMDLLCQFTPEAPGFQL